MKKLNVAIIGCGNVSKCHFDAIAENENAKLIATCDIIKEKADKYAVLYNAKAYKIYDELLENEKLDVVHICLPHYLHCPVAIKAMEKGINVFTEKPIAITYDDAQKMVASANSNNVKLGVCFQNRYNTASVIIKDIIDSGELGKVLSLKGMVTWDRDEDYYKQDNWHGTLKYEGGGVMINQAIHTLDLINWFSGSSMEDIKASASQKRLMGKVETEDTADALITYKNGVTALFYATLCNKANSPVFIEVCLEKGRVVLYDELTVYYDNGTKKVIDLEKASGKKAYWGLSHKLIIDDFYNSIINNCEFAINGQEALKTMEIIDTFYKKSR